MKALIRKVASWLQVKTTYHIAATYAAQDGMRTMSQTITVRPWVHTDNYGEVVEYMQKDAPLSIGRVVITSLTKLGL